MSKKSKLTKYDTCKSKIVNSYMKKYEKGSLLGSNNKAIKNRQQALAIALSTSERLCEKNISSKDIIKMENKVNKMLFTKNGKLSDEKVQLTNVKNAIFLINYYKNKKNYRKKNILEKQILARCLLSTKKNKLSNLIYNELNKIIKLVY